MSHTASMNLLSFDLLRAPGSVDTRLKWALAGSVAVHVAFASMAILRFMPMIDRPVASYHVDLVTLADIQASPAPAPESEPRPAPTVPPREPERITDSLVGALESVVVPAPRNVEVANNVEPVSTPSPASQPSPLEFDVPRVQSPPRPPQLASGPPRIQPTRPSPIPTADSLAQTLKQAVETVVVPKIQRESSDVPLPSQPPQPAESPPLKKNKVPVHAPKISRLVKSVKQPSRPVKTPEVKNAQVTPVESPEVSLIPGLVPQNADEDRKEVPVVVPSPAPTLAKVAQDHAPSRPTVAKTPSTPSRPDNDRRENAAIDNLPIPEVKPLQSHRLSSPQTEGGTHETLTKLHVGGSASEANKYWAQVWSKIDREWVAPPVAIHQQEPLQVVLAIRVEQTGRVQEEALAFVQKSGNEYYDSAAKRAVVAASPLPPFPPHMTEPYYDFKFRFTVKLNQ